MKSKKLNFFLLVTSLIGYMEWGADNHSFLFQAEGEVLSKLFTDPASVLHPFTILPLTGQMILLVTLFQRTPNKILTYVSIGCLGILLVFIFVIGLVSFNFRIAISSIPFIVAAVMAIIHYRNAK